MALRNNPNQEFDKLKHAAVTARLPFEREAWLNLAFYLDEQYVEWHADSGSIRRIPRDNRTPNVPRPIVNKIMHFVQQEKAMVLQAKPTVDVLPATDDLMDITNAGVSKAYCTWAAEPVNANFTRQLGRATLWAIVCGDGYLKWTWNPIDKRPEITPVPLFELAVDPYASDFAKARYMIHSRFMDVDSVQDAYGVKVTPGKEEHADPMRAELLRGMGSAPVVSGVTVNELWHKPCTKYPEGLYVVWTGRDTLVERRPLPYTYLREHKKLPFTQIGCIERPDSKHYMSPVKYLRSAQMELNKFHAQRIMIREAFAAPKWWIPAELELEEQPNDSPRQILRGSGASGQEPKLIQPASYPSGEDGQIIESQMMHIVGLHEVSQAQVPGRVEAAKAIEMLKEADADRQATMLDTINASISEGFWQLLMQAKEFETDGKMVQAYSREGLPEVRRFKAEMVDPGMRVQVTMGTGLARSRAARQDQLLLLWQNKIVTDAEQMAELMEVPIPTFTAPKMLDMRLARNENIEMARAVAIQPNSWDEHEIHLREHNNFRKTQEYLTASGEVKKRFEFHCQLHEELLATQLGKRAQLMAISQGATLAPAAAQQNAGAAQSGYPQFAQPVDFPDGDSRDQTATASQ